MGFSTYDLIYFIHNLTELTVDHTKRVRLCEHGRGISRSECRIALGVQLHRSRSHRSLTKDSIEGLIMQRPSYIYISAEIYYV